MAHEELESFEGSKSRDRGRLQVYLLGHTFHFTIAHNTLTFSTDW